MHPLESRVEHRHDDMACCSSWHQGIKKRCHPETRKVSVCLSLIVGNSELSAQQKEGSSHYQTADNLASSCYLFVGIQLLPWEKKLVTYPASASQLVAARVT